MGGGAAGDPRAPPPQAVLPPTVATEPADHVQTTSAVLHASVTPNGAPTTYRFKYGRTTAYGLVTSRASAGSGTTPVDVQAKVDGLRPGTTYHFQIAATNAAGTVQGSDATFKTSQLEPRLRGRFRVRLRIKSAGGVYGHRKGNTAHRTYSFNPRCNRSRCARVHLVRRGQRGHFRSTLKRVGPGIYRGVERFRRGLCDDGLPFHSRAPIKVAVTRARAARAQRIKGEMKVLVAGCAHGRERARFTGRLRG
jgi:Fibronectin type III domain